MTFPNDSDLSSLSREQIINLLLTSIAIEEIALAHMVETEAELLQLALGKVSANGNGKDCPMVKSVDDLLRINRSVNRTLKTITKKESILLAKLKEVVSLIEGVPEAGFSCSATAATGEAVMDAVFINDEIIDFNGAVDKIDLSIGENCTMETDRIQIKFSDGTCPFAAIALVEGTAKILCNPKFNTALISATVDVNAANKRLDGVYKALISISDNGNMVIFLENERNRILFRISGANVKVEKCLNTEPEPTNICECGVNITTNLNTTIILTGDNVFFPGRVQAVAIDVACDCEAANSFLSVLVRYVIGGVSIPGEFIEGTISTLCDGNDAIIQGSVILGGIFYNVYIQANQNGTVTAIFEGVSTFTLTLSGANVVISGCNNSI